jgi:hypothetical protein
VGVPVAVSRVDCWLAVSVVGEVTSDGVVEGIEVIGVTERDSPEEVVPVSVLDTVVVTELDAATKVCEVVEVTLTVVIELPV